MEMDGSRMTFLRELQVVTVAVHFRQRHCSFALKSKFQDKILDLKFFTKSVSNFAVNWPFNKGIQTKIDVLFY